MTASLLFAGRAALVTGGAGRIGGAVASTLLREGARVAIADRDVAQLAVTAAAVNYDASASTAPDVAFTTIAGDTAAAGDVIRIVDEAEFALGPLDVLVTCAAIYPNAPLLDMDVAVWDDVYAVNVRGVMLVSQIVGRRWVSRGTRGSMVHLSSGAARSARRGASAYCGSKAALEMLVEVLALELGPHGIRVNAVAPGLVTDEVIDASTAEKTPYVREMLRATPLGRTGAPAEIAEAVAFIASDKSSWTTGSVLDVTGGSLCGRAHLDYISEPQQQKT